MVLGGFFGKEVVGKLDEDIGWGVGTWFAVNSLSVLALLYQLNIRGSEYDTPESRKDLFRTIWKCNIFVIGVCILDVVRRKLDWWW